MKLEVLVSSSKTYGLLRRGRSVARSSVLASMLRSDTAAREISVFEGSWLRRRLALDTSVQLEPVTKFGVLLVVFLVFTTRPYTIQRALGLQFGGVNVYLVSIVLVATLAVAGLQILTSDAEWMPIAILPVLLFTGYFCLRGIASLGTWEAIEVAREMRHIPYYLFVIPLFLTTKTRRDCWRLVGAMVAGSLVAIGLFALGQFGFYLPGTVGRGWLTRQYVNEVTFLPALYFLLAYVWLAKNRASQVASAVAVLVLGAIWLSGTRTLLIALVGCLPILYLSLSGRDTIDLGLWTLCSIVLGVLAFVALTLVSSELRACLQGQCTPGGPITFARSLGFRVQAWYYWLQLFFEQPIFGWGLGIRYQDFFSTGSRLVGGLRGSSGVFWSLAKLGLLGSLLYGWAVLAGARTFVARWQQLRPTDREGRALLAGAIASTLSVLFEGTVHSNGVATISNIVILLALFAIIVRSRAPDGSEHSGRRDVG